MTSAEPGLQTAGAAEERSPVRGPVPVPPACGNCGTPVIGSYCGVCGQRFEPHIQSLGAFLKEATESLTHADSRLWRTLRALSVRPGLLTREFLDGRRASYLPPFRLYLVVSVLFFVVAGLVGDGGAAVTVDGAESRIVIGGDPARSPQVRQELAELAREADRAARTASSPTEKAVAERARTLAAAASGDGTSNPCAEVSYEGPWKATIEPRMQRSCERIRADGGRGIGREFMANMPTVLILFLPLIAAVMKLFYWRPRRFYVEHLLFFVHNHAFVFVLFTVVLVLAAPLPEGVGDLLTLGAFVYCAWYLFRAMRVVYGQGRALTTAKYLALGVTYFIGGAVLTVATLLYSAMTL